MISDKIFCPEIGGYCIEGDCAAYVDHMMIEDINGSIFIKNAIKKELDYDPSINFFLKIGFCSKYNKVTNKVSFDLLENFKKEIS